MLNRLGKYLFIKESTVKAEYYNRQSSMDWKKEIKNWLSIMQQKMFIYMEIKSIFSEIIQLRKIVYR